MRSLRILFTGVGRRIELLQAFREAALIMNVNLCIFGADMTGTAPALAYCDYTRKICAMKDKNYINELATICKRDNIDLVIPTIDTDLLILSENVKEFKNTKVLISKPDKIAICRNKNKTAKFFEFCGCKAPKTFDNWEEYQGPYPCFIKPQDGSSSINAFKAQTPAELEMYAKQIENYVIQPFIEGMEYTVDVFCDFDGKPVYITPRIRLQVRAGEVLKTQIAMDEKIIEEVLRITEKFKPVGPITIQLIRQNVTGDDYFIEINPRFGGGAPLSMRAGAKSAETILALLLGMRVKRNYEISDGITFSRFDQSVQISTGHIRQPVKGVIFDLDDTLYSEKQYVKSGFKAVAKYLERPNAERKLWSYFEDGKPAIDTYLEEIELIGEKENCLKIYREHIPAISLYDSVEEIIAKLREARVKVGIITDGRPVGQRRKINALGLQDLVEDIIITDELGGEQFRKPCDIAFRIMQRRWRIPFENIIYIGDNISKDFQAPKQLGMQWLWINNPDGLYQSTSHDESKVTTGSILSVLKYVMEVEDYSGREK